MYDSICNALENKNHICLVFCDISKAFDRVWHKGLIKKLNAYGFKGNFLNWLTDYLSNRTQQVIIKNNRSNIGNITAGVPQGSVLGPLLFLIYINDIADELESLARLFADDTSLAYASTSTLDIETTMNRDMNKLSEWSKRWLTIFNPIKTKLLFISNTIDATNLNIMFDGVVLNPVQSHRHLGVSLSSDAKWATHVNELFQSCMKKVNVLRKFKYILNRKTILRIYKSFILPILEYACEVWDGCTERDKQRLESIQLEAARIACGLPVYCKKEAIYYESDLEPLEIRRERRKLMILFKMHNNQTPPFFQALLPQTVAEVSRYSLRNRDNYIVPNFRLTLSERSFIPSTVKLWNNLDDMTKNCETLNSFKMKISQTSQTLSAIKCFEGNRKLNIIHTRLRHNCSILKYDLYRCNLIEDPSCACGYPCENAFHYFFECSLYTRIRTPLLNTVLQFGNVDLQSILYGKDCLTIDDNIIIFKAVHRYIRDSGRF